MGVNNNKVSGSELILLIKRQGSETFKPLLCQTGLTIDRTREVRESSTNCGVDKKKNEPQDSVKVEGKIIYGLADVITIKDVEEIYENREYVQFRVVPIEMLKATDIALYSFGGSISAISDNFGSNEDATQSITITAYNVAIETLIATLLQDGDGNLIAVDDSTVISISL